MENKYFGDVKNVSMAELINWFMIEYTDLVDDMHNCTHAAKTNEPNIYHIEGDVFCHSMMVCQEARNDNIIVKLVALLHDSGKVDASETFDYYDKEKINKMTDEKLKEKYSKEYNEWNEWNESKESKEPVFQNTFKGYLLTKKEGKYRNRFVGHEGISAWMSIAPLKRLKSYGVITEEDINEIFKSISLHSNLFNRIKDGKEHKPEQIVNLFSDFTEYKNYIK